MQKPRKGNTASTEREGSHETGLVVDESVVYPKESTAISKFLDPTDSYSKVGGLIICKRSATNCWNLKFKKKTLSTIYIDIEDEVVRQNPICNEIL